MLHYRCTAIGILFPLGNRAIASGLSIGLCWMMFPATRGNPHINTRQLKIVRPLEQQSTLFLIRATGEFL
jgi:hypothetical protein